MTPEQQAIKARFVDLMREYFEVKSGAAEYPRNVASILRDAQRLIDDPAAVGLGLHRFYSDDPAWDGISGRTLSPLEQERRRLIDIGLLPLSPEDQQRMAAHAAQHAKNVAESEAARREYLERQRLEVTRPLAKKPAAIVFGA